MDNFFDGVALGRSNIFFKIRLYKFLPKFRELKNFMLLSTISVNYAMLIKKVCHEYAGIFGTKEKNIETNLPPSIISVAWNYLRQLFLHKLWCCYSFDMLPHWVRRAWFICVKWSIGGYYYYVCHEHTGMFKKKK